MATSGIVTRLLVFLLLASVARADIHVLDGSTWRQSYEVWVNDGGTWRNIQEVYVNDGGTWRSVCCTRFLLTDRLVVDTVGQFQQASASFSLNSNGTTTPAVSNEWRGSVGVSSQYEARATLTSGTCSTGTFNTWQNMGGNLTWTRTRTGAGTSECIFTLEIRIAATGEVRESASITLRAVVLSV